MASCEFCGCKVSVAEANRPPEGEGDFYYCDKEECIEQAFDKRNEYLEEKEAAELDRLLRNEDDSLKNQKLRGDVNAD